MAYPPPTPPANRTDSTVSAQNHAQDHNLIASALRDLLEELGAGPSGNYANLTERLLGISAGQDSEAIRAFLEQSRTAAAAATAAGASATTAQAAAELAAAIAIGDADAAIAVLLGDTGSEAGQALATAVEGLAADTLAETEARAFDTSTLNRLAAAAAGDRSASVANQRLAWEDAAGFTTNWTNLDGTVNAGVGVTAGRLHRLTTPTRVKIALTGLEGPFRITTSIDVVDDGTTTTGGQCLVGVTAGTAGDGSDAGSGKFWGIGLHGSGFAGRWQGGQEAPAGYYRGITATDRLPSGRYYVTIVGTDVELSATMHNADRSIYIRNGIARTGFASAGGGPLTGVALFPNDTRNAAGCTIGPVVVRLGRLTGKPRGAEEPTASRVAKYAVGPRHTRFATFHTPPTYDSRAPLPVVVYWHGSSDTDEDTTPAAKPTHMGPMVKALTDAGFLVTASDFGGLTNWGNAEAQTTMAELYQHLRDAYPIGPIGYIANSMGATGALNSLARRTVPVLSAYLIQPAANLGAAHAGNYTSPIRTAYGVASDGSDYATKTAGYDPVLRDGWEFRGVPMRIVSSPSDTAIPQAQHADVLANLVAPYTPDLTRKAATGNHSDVSHFDPADAVAFFQRTLRAGA